MILAYTLPLVAGWRCSMQLFRISQEGHIERVRVEGMIEDEPVWIITSKRELEEQRNGLKLEEEMVALCLLSDEMPKVEIYSDYDIGVFRRLVYKNQQYKAQSLKVMISQKRLVVVADGEAAEALEGLVQSLEDQKKGTETLGYIFYRFFDWMISEDQHHLETMASRTERLEEAVLNEEVKHFIKEMIEIRKQVTLFKCHYNPLMDIVEDLMDNENELCSKEDVRYFKMLKQRLNRLNHLTQEIDEYTTHVREAYDAQIDIHQNRIMKFFTLITSLFLPLTLITGWYGMNFTSMPELSWQYGYLYVIVISLLSSLICLIYIKKKKWF